MPLQLNKGVRCEQDTINDNLVAWLDEPWRSAPAFQPYDVRYAVGDGVLHDDHLYRCRLDVPLGTPGTPAKTPGQHAAYWEQVDAWSPLRFAWANVNDRHQGEAAPRGPYPWRAYTLTRLEPKQSGPMPALSVEVLPGRAVEGNNATPGRSGQDSLWEWRVDVHVADNVLNAQYEEAPEYLDRLVNRHAAVFRQAVALDATFGGSVLRGTRLISIFPGAVISAPAVKVRASLIEMTVRQNSPENDV